MDDVLILGGGAVGLSLAYELARRGVRVRVLDRADPGRGASWAAAGILPPPAVALRDDPLEQLRARSHQLHFTWAEWLREETGIDYELRRCGGLYLARQAAEASLMAARLDHLREEGIRAESLETAEVVAREPALQPIASQLRTALLLPDECRIRPPRFLKALIAGCQRHGVGIEGNIERIRVDRVGDQIRWVVTPNGRYAATHYLFAMGAWAGELLQELGIQLPIEPRRGQVVLWNLPEPLVAHVVNEGLRYVVPRDDGCLLAGATVEEVGFDQATTPDALQQLCAFASNLLPQLKEHSVQHAWAGLRPWTPDGLPYLGPLPGLENACVAVGHFRSGIHLAPATAELLADVLLAAKPASKLHPFRIGR